MIESYSNLTSKPKAFGWVFPGRMLASPISEVILFKGTCTIRFSGSRSPVEVKLPNTFCDKTTISGVVLIRLPDDKRMVGVMVEDGNDNLTAISMIKFPINLTEKSVPFWSDNENTKKFIHLLMPKLYESIHEPMFHGIPFPLATIRRCLTDSKGDRNRLDILLD